MRNIVLTTIFLASFFTPIFTVSANQSDAYSFEVDGKLFQLPKLGVVNVGGQTINVIPESDQVEWGFDRNAGLSPYLDPVSQDSVKYAVTDNYILILWFYEDDMEVCSQRYLSVFTRKGDFVLSVPTVQSGTCWEDLLYEIDGEILYTSHWACYQAWEDKINVVVFRLVPDEKALKADQLAYNTICYAPEFRDSSMAKADQRIIFKKL